MTAIGAALIRLATTIDDLDEIGSSQLVEHADDLDQAAEAIEAVVLAVRAGGRRPVGVLLEFAEQSPTAVEVAS